MAFSAALRIWPLHMLEIIAPVKNNLQRYGLAHCSAARCREYVFASCTLCTRGLERKTLAVGERSLICIGVVIVAVLTTGSYKLYGVQYGT